jgi:NADPH-dependent curcumin reductase CurA
MMVVVSRRLRLQGFIILDHFSELGEFQRDMGQWVREGRIKWKETVVEGLENAPGALMSLFKGANVGKMLVKLA